MTDFYTLVRDFHRKFGIPHHYEDATQSVMELRSRLITEEAVELVEALADEDIEQALKEACDLLYVTFGLFVSLGIRPDEFFREVHASNMSKVDENGQPRFRSDGKLTKEGTRHWKADMSYLVSQKLRDYAFLPDEG